MAVAVLPDRLERFPDELVVGAVQLLQVRVVLLRVRVTFRTDIVVNGRGLGLQDPDAPTVEPVGAALAADVESTREEDEASEERKASAAPAQYSDYVPGTANFCQKCACQIFRIHLNSNPL